MTWAREAADHWPLVKDAQVDDFNALLCTYCRG
jgi:hypothetical protein